MGPRGDDVAPRLHIDVRLAFLTWAIAPDDPSGDRAAALPAALALVGMAVRETQLQAHPRLGGGSGVAPSGAVVTRREGLAALALIALAVGRAALLASSSPAASADARRGAATAWRAGSLVTLVLLVAAEAVWVPQWRRLRRHAPEEWLLHCQVHRSTAPPLGTEWCWLSVA